MKAGHIRRAVTSLAAPGNGLMRLARQQPGFQIVAEVNWAILEQKRNNAGVDDDLRHAAESVRL